MGQYGKNNFFDHPSIRNIKQKSKTENKFSLKPVNEDLVRGIVKELSINKVASGDIAVKELSMNKVASGDIAVKLLKGR